MKNPSLVTLGSNHYYRIIPSHFPPIELFEAIYDNAEELAIAYELESLTNPRLRAESGDLHILPPEKWRFGPGATPIMAAFTHIGFPSRFTDGSFGIYYAAENLATAIAETSYHRALFLSATKQPDQEITMRVYSGSIKGNLHDISGSKFKKIHHPINYKPSQDFAEKMRNQGSNGLLYSSVRNLGSSCVAIFNPLIISIPKQRQHLRYFYDSKKESITNIFEIKKITS